MALLLATMIFDLTRICAYTRIRTHVHLWRLSETVMGLVKFEHLASYSEQKVWANKVACALTPAPWGREVHPFIKANWNLSSLLHVSVIWYRLIFAWNIHFSLVTRITLSRDFYAFSSLKSFSDLLSSYTDLISHLFSFLVELLCPHTCRCVYKG